jgi:NTP pyrophosphatase (non-canonical NTP hydrolase)
MATLSALQTELNQWRHRNFPDTFTSQHQLMGVVEEVGELSHALLKQQQGIRGSYEEHDEAMKDAIADIVIYLMGICSNKAWDLSELVMSTGESVLNRDWISFPQDGTTR